MSDEKAHLLAAASARHRRGNNDDEDEGTATTRVKKWAMLLFSFVFLSAAFYGHSAKSSRHPSATSVVGEKEAAGATKRIFNLNNANVAKKKQEEETLKTRRRHPIEAAKSGILETNGTQVEANLRMIPSSISDLFEEYEEEESHFANNARCENVFTLGLEGVGHHAFQMGKDAFVNTLLSDHLNNVIEKKKNTNNNNEVFKDIVEEHARQVDDMFNYDEEIEGKLWNLVQENNYDELFRTFREGCEEEAKKNGNEKTVCYSTRSFSFPFELGPFATGSGFDVGHIQRWDPQNQDHRNYLFNHGHPINILEYFEAAKRNGCQVKFILIHRNFVEAALAHKTWDLGLENHMNVLKMFAEYINVSLANLPSSSWRRVNYEDFWRPNEERDKIMQTLTTDFLHWSSDAHEAFVNSQFNLNVHSKKYITSNMPSCEEIRELDRVQRDFIDRELTAYSKQDQHVTNLPLSHFHTDSPNAELYEQCWEASKAR